MYKLIVLIISSSDGGIYSYMKKISQLYLTLFTDKIKFFYLEYNNSLGDEPVYNIDNHLYFQGTDSITPGMYQKTIKAIEYINKNYEYEFILRTNLSSFLNLNNILSYLDLVPNINFAGGYSFQGFISGTGIFMSRDVGNILIQDQRNDDINEDVLISNIISQNNIPIINITAYKWGFLTDADESHLPPNCEFISCGAFDENIKYSSNILYFRIKNGSNRNIDIQYFKLLIKNIYNIEYDENIIDNKISENINEHIKKQKFIHNKKKLLYLRSSRSKKY